MVGLRLIAKPDERTEFLGDDKVSIDVFTAKEEKNKMNTSDDLALAGHVPIEIPSLLYYFRKAEKDNAIHVKVTGARKCNIVLLVPGRYSKELQKKKGMFLTL